MNQLSVPIRNPLDVSQHYDKLYSVVLSANNIAVDTFLVMGALLVTISTLNSLETKNFNICRMIFHRYLRYTPVFAALILYIISLSKFTVNGPLQIDEIRTHCVDNYWLSLLHVQNYVNPHSQCLSHAWYLSADFQLFIITPLLIFPAWKFGYKYLLALPTLAVLSSVYMLVLCFERDLRVLPSSQQAAETSGQWIYYATHARMGSWLSGIVLGFVLFKYQDRKIEISRCTNTILWIASVGILTCVIVLAQPLNQRSNDTSLAFNAFYLAFHRQSWALAICWIIFACHKLKTGGIIRWFLCLPQWKPIARMSLSMYLVHPLYQLTAIMNQKDSLTFEIWLMVRN